jgi:hypothetical protein
MMSVLSPLTISPVNRWYGRQQRGRGLSCNTCPIWILTVLEPL